MQKFQSWQLDSKNFSKEENEKSDGDQECILQEATSKRNYEIISSHLVFYSSQYINLTLSIFLLLLRCLISSLNALTLSFICKKLCQLCTIPHLYHFFSVIFSHLNKHYKPVTVKMSSTGKQSIFDVSKLSTSSLRKYQSYFGLNCTDEELKQKVKEHFDKELKAEPNQVIDRFLELKRQDKDKKGGRARNPRMPPV